MLFFIPVMSNLMTNTQWNRETSSSSIMNPTLVMKIVQPYLAWEPKHKHCTF
jgi:hypothetical protein